ncbi:hypothetical protein BU23DRAFT_105597 [Bimuria novae-zelandiae CBS 107.79]|uniref:Integral membrane protein n=1 Tax=Bimuria novae-zelandiae CBS 107.79 TaxID=1447943 RepID=A0A6A5VR16_9PLEO|nr:hypothetical protein BU23DRAFT_105597 [Bimuria novae-zelandiae CBS 107.79]
MATATLLGLSLPLPPPALTALRLTPLLTTTASLTHAYMEYLTTTSFLTAPPTHNALTFSMAAGRTAPNTTTHPHKNAAQVAAALDTVVPVWFVNFFNTGVWSVIGLNSLTLLSSAANLWVVGGLGAARGWYAAGFVGALAHYAFVPGVSGAVEGLHRLCVRGAKGEVGEKGRAARLVREWVGVHKVRWATVDLVAWVGFAVGVVRVLTP